MWDTARCLETVVPLRRCVWCNRIIDPTNGLEVEYQTCYDHLIPLPTD